MGWSHALYWCQRVLEEAALKAPGLTSFNQLTDSKVAPSIDPVVHSEYVDNFVAFSQCQGPPANSVAGVAAANVHAALGNLGLTAHPVESTRGGEALGWVFSASEPQLQAKPLRLWRLRLAT
eukprot:879570-Lingulodinium_polyedra.AAC.1